MTAININDKRYQILIAKFGTLPPANGDEHAVWFQRKYQPSNLEEMEWSMLMRPHVHFALAKVVSTKTLTRKQPHVTYQPGPTYQCFGFGHNSVARSSQSAAFDHDVGPRQVHSAYRTNLPARIGGFDRWALFHDPILPRLAVGAHYAFP